MAEQRRHIRFVFRGQLVVLDQFMPGRTLLDWLRRDQRAYGVKEGCAEGDCGACTVIVRRMRDGVVHDLPVNACILLLGQVDGAEVLTVEDLPADGVLHPVQEALVRHHGSQCGFCTPGIVMSLAALHGSGVKNITRSDVADTLAGNLCRCTGYRPIVDAMMEANRQPPGDAYARARAGANAQLAALADADDIFVGNTDAFFASPASEDQLAEWMEAHPDAVILGGATDFGLRLTKEMIEPRKIVWLGRVPSLRRIQKNDTDLVIGAGVTIAEAQEALGSIDPDLAEMLRRFGSKQVRASGTVGGNIANGSPVGDLPPVLIALGATLELRKGSTHRMLPLEQFFLAYKKQDRSPGEYVSSVRVPLLAKNEFFRAFKLSKRFDEDISAVCLAAKFTIEGEAIAAARIACGAMAGTPARAWRTEQALIGLSLNNEASWQIAISMLRQDFSPLSDQRASADYRSRAAENLLYKILLELAGNENNARILPRQAAE